MSRTGTYDASVVDEVVETGVPKARLEVLCGCADTVEVTDVELDDVQCPFCGVLQVKKCGRLLWGTDARDDEVGRRLKELPHDLEADSAIRSERI